MGKSLSEVIAAKIAQRPASQNAKNRTAFLANMEEIRQALDDGWSRKIVWETLKEQGKISFGYQAFLRYVSRMIVPAVAPAAEKKPDQAQTVEKPLVETMAEKSELEGIKGFTWNPNPKKEDLY